MSSAHFNVLQHETAERLEVLRRADRYEQALSVKDQMLWVAMQASNLTFFGKVEQIPCLMAQNIVVRLYALERTCKTYRGLVAILLGGGIEPVRSRRRINMFKI